MSSKSKGRSFEREIYKTFRDSKLFKKVNLTLGSGSTDEPSDINATDYSGSILVFELKTGDRKYITENNLNRWWDKLVKSCSNEYLSYLIYREDYKPIMVMFVISNEFGKIRVRVEFDRWMKWMKPV